MARQMGKIELSAHLEAYLLDRFAIQGGSIVKAAPTFRPQVTTSMLRLEQLLRRSNQFRNRWRKEHGYSIAVGEASADGRAIRLLIATGAVLPQHYLAEGGNVNRASASEMGPPSAKRFKRRQRLFKAALVGILQRVLDEAQRVGRLDPRVDRSFAIEMEEIKDAEETPAETMGRALQSLAHALALAVERGFVDLADARRLWQRFADRVDASPPTRALSL